MDYFWKRLSAGGKEVQCGWLKDKYGISWQIVPTVLGELLSNKDAAKAQRVMDALLKMVKLDIKKLKRACEPAGRKSGKRRQPMIHNRRTETPIQPIITNQPHNNKL